MASRSTRARPPSARRSNPYARRRARPPRLLHGAHLGRWPQPLGMLLLAAAAMAVATVWRPALYVAALAWGAAAAGIVLDARLRGRVGLLAGVIAAAGGPLVASLQALAVRRAVRKVGRRFGRAALVLAGFFGLAGTIVAAAAGRWAVDQVAHTVAVPSNSMSPKIRKGDRVVTTHLLGDALERGDVVAVDWFPRARQVLNRGGDLAGIYRVVGLPNEYIGATANRLYLCVRAPDILDGVTEEDGCAFPDETAYVTRRMPDFGPVLVPPGRIFVMSDNRALVDDSRIFGPVAPTLSRGQVVGTAWPPGRIGLR